MPNQWKIYILHSFNEEIGKMSTKWRVAFVTTTLVVIVVSFLNGYSSLAVPVMLALSFFLLTGIATLRTLMEESSTPGLEKLQKPDSMSPIYLAWLYVNNRKRWAKYTCIFSYAMGLVFGSMFGFIPAILLKLDYPPPISWLAGILWMSTIAIMTARSKLLAGTGTQLTATKTEN